MQVERTYEGEPTRLDAALMTLDERVQSRRVARELCAEGRVMVNGTAARAGTTVKAGDRIVVIGTIAPVRPDPELGRAGLDTIVRTLFEDDDLLVVEKERGAPSVRLRSDDGITVADCLAAKDPRTMSASRDPRESGLVNRLDTMTSGILLAAKSAEIWKRLRTLIAEGRVEKSYLALVEGIPDWRSAVCDRPLRSAGAGSRMEAVSPGQVGLSARTEVDVVATFPAAGTSVCRAHAARGRRHQVRAHLAALGLPLTGDEQYGSARDLSAVSSALPFLSAVRPSLDGFLLHAERVRFDHPRTGVTIDIVSASSVLSTAIEG